MTSTFLAASTLVPDGDLRFRWQVPDRWQQGKGAFGGLVLGTLLRAMQACEPERERLVRSISGELCGPMMATATEIVVTVLRRGRGTTYLEARALQDGALVARASALLAGARQPGVAQVAAPPPVLPRWRELPVAPMGQPPTPVFTGYYAYRPVGPGVYAGAAEPVCAGWVSELEPPAAIDAPAMIGLLDAWWPCALVVESSERPRAMATVTFTAELLCDPASLDPALPFAYRAHLAGLADGFSVELRHLWQGDRLVGLNQQVFAML